MKRTETLVKQQWKKSFFVVSFHYKKAKYTRFKNTEHTICIIVWLLCCVIVKAQKCSRPPFAADSKILIEGLRTTIACTDAGFYIWGDSASKGGQRLSSPRMVSPENGYDFEGEPLMMTLGDVNEIDGSPQIILLTTTGIYVWGDESSVFNKTLTVSEQFQPLNDLNGNGLPISVSPEDVVAMSASDRVLVLLTNMGDVYVYAFVIRELTGDNSPQEDDLWHQADIQNVTQIKVQQRTLFAVTGEGDFYTWGREALLANGQGYSKLGIPTKMEAPFLGIPAAIALTAGADQGERTSYYALDSETQQVFALGTNNRGQLGIGNQEDQLIWKIVRNQDNSGNLEDVVFLTAADNSPGHPAVGVITSDGVPYFWGDNDKGMLTGDADFYALPKVPDGFTPRVDFSKYIGVAGNSIWVQKEGNLRPCFAGYQAQGNVGNGDPLNVKNEIRTLDCQSPPLLDYCFNPPTADLVTIKTVSNSNPKEGETIQYTLQVTNNGPRYASNITATDVLPEGITFLNTNNAIGGTQNTYNGTTGIWSIGDLALEEVASIEIEVQVNIGTAGNSIINTLDGPAVDNGNTEDPTDEGDLLSVIIDVQQDADGDGVTDEDELNAGTDPNDFCDFLISDISLPASETFLQADCDGDGVTNEQELMDGTDFNVPCDFIVDNVSMTPSGTYLEEDCDGDGVTNGSEINDSTNPNDACDFLLFSSTLEPSETFLQNDCDADGVVNGKEISDGTDPLDSCDSIGGNPPEEVDCNPEKEPLEIDISIDNELVGSNVDNGFFRIDNIEAFPNNKVEIFNRWGVKVFTIKGYNNEVNNFRGISNARATIQQGKKLPPGIYFYMIRYLNNNQNLRKSGYLYLQ